MSAAVSVPLSEGCLPIVTATNFPYSVQRSMGVEQNRFSSSRDGLFTSSFAAKFKFTV